MSGRYRRRGRYYNDYVNVWTDGACSGNGFWNFCGGVGVFWGDDHPWNHSGRAKGRTNNSCEIEAARIAIEIAKDNDVEKLRIHTDSKFLYESMVHWMTKWLRNGWMNCRGREVINRRDFEKINDELDDETIEVFWKFVPGHSGNYGNEMADELARDGTRKWYYHGFYYY